MAYNVHDFKSGDKLYAVQLNEMDTQIAANTEAIETMGDGTVSWNDLTDKPFGERDEWDEILPETSVTFTKGGLDDCNPTLFPDGGLISGTYKAVFDGKEYPDLKVVYQDHQYLLPPNGLTEECPFQIRNGFEFYVLKPGTHTVAMYKKRTVVTQIPSKYIPFGVTWMHLSANGSGKYNVYHGKTADGNGSRMKKSEFLAAFEYGIVMHDADAYDNVIGHVLGYKINSASGELTLKLPESSTGVVFASE